MRILVDNSGYHLLNLGDIAMLQVTVSRLNERWPDAAIGVITYSKDRLAVYCPGAIPVGSDFLQKPFISILPGKAQFGLVQLHKILLPRILSGRRFRIKRYAEQTQVVEPEVMSLADALIGADLVVVSGGGFITDSFKLHGIGVLSILSAAIRMGKPVAMFGQGIGPLRSRLFRRVAAAILPSVNFIALREGRSGPSLLKALGVKTDHILVTGDDAVEMAYSARGTEPGNGLGVNLRVAQYAKVDQSVVESVKVVIQQAAGRLRAPLVPVPVSLYDRDSDSRAIQNLISGYDELSEAGEAIDTPIKVIKQIGKCRVVITGSYHAAVFALAQGIPAVCLTNSQYYDDKFLGLADLYGAGCQIVSLAGPELNEMMTTAIDKAWQSAEPMRCQLLKVASGQIKQSRSAYQWLFNIVESNCKHKRTEQCYPSIRPGSRSSQGFQPIRILEVELSKPLPALYAFNEKTGRCYKRFKVLVRLHTRPLGFLDLQLEEDRISAGVFASQVWRKLQQPINEHLRENGLEPIDRLTAEGLPYSKTISYLEDRDHFLMCPPSVEVIVCTRDRTDQLALCLAQLTKLEYPNYKILVVDNAPKTSLTANLIQQHEGYKSLIQYVREDHPGLSSARNCGLNHTQAEIVAFIDDDELADRYWLAELVKGFKAVNNVACVTGMILPAELETEPQGRFEQFGGHSKGRGFERIIFNMTTHKVQNPLFPNPPFGAGGNMAFKTTVLKELRGFDPALGAGTAACGGEDTAVFLDLLTHGYTLLYEPAAFVWHFHYRKSSELHKQFYGYGVGLTAFYLRCLRMDPKLLFSMLRLTPKALAYLFNRRSHKVSDPEEYFPRDLTIKKLQGMAYGPFAYIHSRRNLRKLAGENFHSNLE